MMNRLCQRQEWTLGSTKVHNFYLSVLELFIQKVYKDNRYRSNSLDELTIDQLEHKIKFNLHRPRFLFQSSLSMREGSSADPERLCKLEYQRILELQASLNINKTIAIKPQQNMKIEEEEQEYYIDDLKECDGQEESIMKEEDDDAPISPSIVHSLKFEDDSSSFSESPVLTGGQYQPKTNSIIFGTKESIQAFSSHPK